MTTVQLLPAAPDQLPLLQNLWHLYIHDFTDYLDEEVDEQGHFAFDYDMRRYFQKPGFWSYVPRVTDRIAGFALVSDRIYQRRGEGRQVDEFFILRRYRRKGIGRSVAFQMYDMFRGYWETAVIGPNLPAQHFWRKVIGDYTDGRFEEVTVRPGDMDILVFMFDSGTW
jgi:predicted acetyltransferase